MPGRPQRPAGGRHPRRRRDVPLRHRPDRPDHARPHRRRPRLRRRAAGGLAGAEPGRPALPRVLPGRLARSTSRPTPARWPTRSSGSAARTRPQGYLRYVDFVSKLYRYEMKDFIDRNIDSPVRPAHAEPGPAGRDRRLPQARAQGRASYLKDPRTQRVLSLPVDVRRAQPVRRAGHLRGDRLHGLGRRRVLPQGRHARRAAGAGRRGREARRGAALRHDRQPGARRARPGGRRRDRPTASGSPPTSSCSTPTCRSPTASCCRPRRPRAG